jgi:hypothetical protein
LFGVDYCFALEYCFSDAVVDGGHLGGEREAAELVMDGEGIGEAANIDEPTPHFGDVDVGFLEAV